MYKVLGNKKISYFRPWLFSLASFGFILLLSLIPIRNAYASIPGSTDVPSYSNTVGSFTGSFAAIPSTLSTAQGIATDASGNVFVLDYSNNRVVKYNSSGAYVKEWFFYVTCGGNPPSLFPIAVNQSNGNVYIADGCNAYDVQSPVSVFSNSGTFLGEWSSYGFSDGQLNTPRGLAVDSSGNVYISDSSNRIQKFDSSGNFITKWGTFGSGNGQFNNPQGIAFDSSGNIYVAEKGNKRVQKFDSSGNYITKWGSSGTGNGQFTNPTGIALDSSNNVYVSDTGNSGSSGNKRIQKFTNSGVYTSQWGSYGTGNGQFTYAVGVAIDSSNNVYVADQAPPSNSRVQKFNTSGTYQSQFNTITLPEDSISGIAELGTDSLGNIYAPDSNNNRIQKFDKNGVHLMHWGTTGAGDGQFDYPNSVTVDSNDYIYVNETNNNRIQKFDSNGNFITKWGTAGAGDGQFNLPSYVASDSSNNIYIVDYYNYRIQKFDSSGNFITKWGSFGSGDGQFSTIGGLAIDSYNNVYVSDNNRIQKFDSSGNFITKWGSFGSGDGQFNGAGGISMDVLNNLYVADSSNNRIQKFDSSGNFITKWGSFGRANGQFFFVNGVHIDRFGQLYTNESNNSRIQKFTYPSTTSYTFNNAPVTGSPANVTLSVPNSTDITCANSVSASSLSSQDSNYSYPLGVVNFCFSVSNGSTNQVSLTFVTDLTPSQVTPRKYNSTTHGYSTIPSYTLTETSASGHHALQLTYSITDGGSLDQDGVANGTIVDPIGLATANASTSSGTSSSTLASTGEDTKPLYLLAILLLLAGSLGLVRKTVIQKNTK